MMQNTLSILFVNPWQDIVGPNIGMEQIVGECLSRGHMVHLLTLAHDECSKRAEELGAKVHVWPQLRLMPRTLNPLKLFTSMVRDWQLSRRLGQFGRGFAIDLICVNSENMLFAPRAGTVARCPSVIFIRGNKFIELGVIGILYFLLQRQWVNKYIANSYSTRKRLHALGVKECMIELAELGVDVNRFSPENETSVDLKSYGVTNESKTIGAVGHFTSRKGMHYFVEAFCRIAFHAPNTFCFIFGKKGRDESERQYLRQIQRRITTAGLDDRVLFMGHCSDLENWLPRMDVVVHPSESESFGRSIAEAMACGRPVIGFDVEAVNELIVNGVTGLLVRPFDVQALGNGILTLLSDRSKNEMMGREGRRRVIEKYSLSTNNIRLVDYIETLVR